MPSTIESLQVLLAFGGNLGNVPMVFRRAALLLASQGVSFVRSSQTYTTLAVSAEGQCLNEDDVPPFQNAASLIETHLTPLALLKITQDVERLCGRIRPNRSMSRPLDIDLIDCKPRRPSPPHLWLPHPRARLRRFVLEPLRDIAPNWILGPNDETVTTLLSALGSQQAYLHKGCSVLPGTEKPQRR